MNYPELVGESLESTRNNYDPSSDDFVLVISANFLGAFGKAPHTFNVVDAAVYPLAPLRASSSRVRISPSSKPI